jgi:serine/threonine protein kinase
MIELFLSEGSILQNRYKVEGLLSSSGIGQVYKASDVRFPGKWWALKVFPTANKDFFEKEAKALTQLNHPHLVKLVDFFREKEKFFLVMDYVNGRPLERILEESGNVFSEKQVLSWGIQCADALIALHAHFGETFFYRAFSPRKILISSLGEVKLVPEMPFAFRGVGVQGVMGFAPPELFEEGVELDERSDIYALAAVLYRCLAGENTLHIPFVFPPLRSVNPRIVSNLDRVLDKATQQKPERRYFHIMEFRKELYHCFQEVLKIYPQPVRLKEESPAGIWWALMVLSGISILAYLLLLL